MAYAKKESSLNLTRMTNLYVGCVLSAFMLFPGFHGYQRITNHKAVLFFLLSGGYVLAMIAMRVRITCTGDRRVQRLKLLWKSFGLTEKLVLGYWIMSIISTLLSDYRGTAFWGGARFEGLVTISLYCVSFLLVSRYGRPKEWMLWIFAGAISVNCLIALIQLMGYNPLNLYPQGMNYYDGFKLYAGQFLGMIGNVDLLSALLCVAIPAFWISMIRMRSKYRYVLLLPLILSISVLFWAFVSGGVLSIILGSILSAPIIAKRGCMRKILAIITIVVVLLGIVLVYTVGDKIGGFVYEAHQVMHGNLDDDFGSGRIYIWRKVLELVDGHLLFGSGPETMGLRTDAVFERYDENLGIMIRSWVDTAHNEYLNVLVNQGMLALLCYLGAVTAALVSWVKRAPQDAVAAVCGGSVLCYCIQAFFGISSLISAPYFWIAFAMLCSAKETTCAS